jgi:hypothetical protein
MIVGGEAAHKRTSEFLDRADKEQQTSVEADVMGTVGAFALLRLHSGTETFLIDETGDAISPIKLVQESTSQRQEIRGKTLGSWGLDRRRAARELMDMWQEAVSHISTDGFAVYVEAVISKAEEYMPSFRDIPSEDVFSGILQLVRDAISGSNFERVQKEKLDGPITDILSLLRKQKIKMTTYKAAHDTLYDLGLLQKA